MHYIEIPRLTHSINAYQILTEDSRTLLSKIALGVASKQTTGQIVTKIATLVMLDTWMLSLLMLSRDSRFMM